MDRVTCQHCGADDWDRPWHGRHSKKWLVRCLACERMSYFTEQPNIGPPVASSTVATSGVSPSMFVPDTSRPEPAPLRTGAMDRFNRAQMGGTVRKAIQQQRRTAAEAAAIDPKLHQLPSGDR